MIYDRDGAHENVIRNIDRVDPSQYVKDVIYHNYTIRGLLDPSSKGKHTRLYIRQHEIEIVYDAGLRFDNNEHSGQFIKDGKEVWVVNKWKAKSIRFESQGNVLIYTINLLL